MLCKFLSPSDSPQRCDIAIVLAGRPERKRYGLELFQQGVVPRLLLSISRSEVRYAAPLFPGRGSELLSIARDTPAERRHFFWDWEGNSGRITNAGLDRSGTYHEISALADYLGRSSAVNSVMLISTSIHLRRVRFCCRKSTLFRDKAVYYVAVPEHMSSFRHRAWWMHRNHWSYLTQEYGKLALYHLLY